MTDPGTPTPNPGSHEAMMLGCLCPVAANAAGNREDGMHIGRSREAGSVDYTIRPTQWHYRLSCPLHGEPELDPEAKPAKRWWQVWKWKR